MKSTAIFAFALAVSLAFGSAASARSFSDMGIDEISALLTAAGRPLYSSDEAATAMEAAAPDQYRDSVFRLTVRDFVTKIYGLVPQDTPRETCFKELARIAGVSPEKDDDAFWLHSSDGYRVAYEDMQPDCMAMARFLTDTPGSGVSDYCYFFFFPYDDASREQSNRDQADFCSSLLQEMSDIGMELGADSMTDDLFDVYGNLAGNAVNVRLLDEPGPTNGRYLLMLAVEPNSPDALPAE